MAKKSSASSRPEKLVRVNAADILHKALTKRQQAAVERMAQKSDADLNYSDIPPLTDKQLASAFRSTRKQLVAVRLDRDVLAWLKGDGDGGYSTRINNILRAVMDNQHSR